MKNKTIEFLLLFIVNISLILSGTVYKVTIDTSLNVRKEATTTSPVVATLYKDQYIYVTNITNGWAEFYKGFCNLEYLVKVTIGENYKTKVLLNFRSGPSKLYDVVTTLASDTNIVYFGNDPFISGWAVTNRGYCDSNYIIVDKTPTTSDIVPTFVNEKIELIGTPLKQYNYPYDYTPGCTIKKYGSCITAVTIAINQIEKRTFTPYNIAKRMIFNDCGIFFSSFSGLGFEVINNPTLHTILKGLKAGHIVPYGAKNSEGAQHWVAVYGYIGNYETLKSSDFLIYDPGYPRSRLSEHASEFPISYVALLYK